MENKPIETIDNQSASRAYSQMIRIGVTLLFLIIVLITSLISSGDIENSLFLAIAAVFGGYMAMNIGANDVANNVGPAVGSKALTMTSAIIIAMIFEAGGAIIAGGDVVSTIKNDIIDIHAFGDDTTHFLWAMMSALLASGLWLNLATVAKAPVSTTHAIVGSVMGAGIAAAGLHIVNWATMGKIIASWFISPVIGGIIAATFLFSIKKNITYRDDRVQASYRWVPIYVAIMSWAFVTYLVLKGLKKIWPDIITMINSITPFAFEVVKNPSFLVATLIGTIFAVVVYIVIKIKLKSKIVTLENNHQGINTLFTVPLIFAAALLSFAHGANDVANAIGPLAAINDALLTGGISLKAGIPFWMMVIGAAGIALGLALYGPRLIKTVGSEITELDQIRAFSIAIAAAITVIIASQLGLPVSSTHIAIGGVFGVGLLREWLRNNGLTREFEQEDTPLPKHKKPDINQLHKQVEQLHEKEDKSPEDYKQISDLYRLIDKHTLSLEQVPITQDILEKIHYVERDVIKKIIVAWVITVPVSAVLSASIFHLIQLVLAE